jgi:hypothetical protein
MSEKNEKPYPAIIIFKSKNIKETTDDLLSFSTSLYQYGYILKSPMEMRYSYTHENQIEIILTFIDEEHSKLWLDHPEIIKYYQNRFSKLIEPPQVIFYPDAYLEADDERNCICKSWPFILLSPEPFTDLSPFKCGKCLNHILLNKIPEAIQFEEWSVIHNHIYEIWLASGLLEKWAEKQLGKYKSELNKNAVKLIKRFYKKNRIHIYYQIWQKEYDNKNICPSCEKKGKETNMKKPLYACKKCFLAFGY